MKSRKTKLRKNVKIAPRVSAAPRSRKKLIKKRALQISKIIGLLLVIYAAFFTVLKFKKFIIHSNYFCINNVIVNNDKFLDNIDNIKGENIFTFDINKLESDCEVLPNVKAVVVERSFPNTILVNITERIPIGQISYGRNVYGIDEDGVIIKLNESMALPKIIGLKIKNVHSGENITSNPKVSELIKKVITIIKTYNMGRLAEFGSLKNINVKRSKNLILDFICQDNEIKIKIGKTGFEEKLVLLETLLSRLEQAQRKKLLYIDMRFEKDINIIPVIYRK